MKDTKKLTILLVFSLIILIGVTVAYAALATNLTITFGSVKQNKMTWNVGFQAGTVNATSTGTSTVGRSCGAATVTATSVSVADTTLSKPGDKCLYELTIKNTGDIAAKLSTITATKPASTTCTGTGAQIVCGNITYKLTTDAAAQNLLAINSTISATSGTQKVYLSAHYTGSSLNSAAVTQSGAKFTLNYQQN